MLESTDRPARVHPRDALLELAFFFAGCALAVAYVLTA